jgi:glucose/arabinose dehydrogenase
MRATRDSIDRHGRARLRARRRRTARSLLALLIVGIGLPLGYARASAEGDPDDRSLLAVPFITSGVYQPTQIEFGGDGRIVVGEKAGTVKIFDSAADTSPTLAIDLRDRVYSGGDRGLLGMTIDPLWPSRPYVYVLYTRDAPPGAEPPVWHDECTGATAGDGCVVSGTLSRLEISLTNQQVGPEVRLIDGAWCQQYESHSIGDLQFGADGALYVSAGEGGSWNLTDYGQVGGSPGSATPVNPCGDPPTPVGTTPTPPTAEGGSLRAQDLNTPGDPLGLSGAVLRIDPDTGAALPDNPLAGGDPADDRHVAFGLRNPFRITDRPGTDEIWIGDVGWVEHEEIDVLPDPTASVTNFGWPCYEGPDRQSQWDAQDLDLCERLYDGTYPAATAPRFATGHPQGPDGCVSFALTGLTFYDPTVSPGAYPARYDGALFFSDFVGCLWAAPLDGSGEPDFDKAESLPGVHFGDAWDLEQGPDGALYLAGAGGIKRLAAVDNLPPVPALNIEPQFGFAPLQTVLDASASSDPDGDDLTYAWDLDSDGEYDDAAGASVDWTFAEPGDFNISVEVSDGELTATASGNVQVVGDECTEDCPPPDDEAFSAYIDLPLQGHRFGADTVLPLRGHLADPAGQTVVDATLSWTATLLACDASDSCTPRWSEGLPEGTESLDLASYDIDLTTPDGGTLLLQLELQAAGPDGAASTTLEVPALVHTLAVHTVPDGIPIDLDGAPRTAITGLVGTTVSVSAPATATVGGVDHVLSSWATLGASTGSTRLTQSRRDLTAVYVPAAAGPTPTAGADEGWTIGSGSTQVFVLANDFLPGSGVEVTEVHPGPGASAFVGFGNQSVQISKTGSPGDATATYRACDDDGVCVDGTITVHRVNRPVLGFDSVQANGEIGEPVVLDVLANDDAGGGSGSATLMAPEPALPDPARGVVTSGPGRNLTYTPYLREGGAVEALQYVTCAAAPPPVSSVCANSGALIQLNFPPLLEDDYLVIDPSATVPVDPLGNDVDTTGGGIDPSTLSIDPPSLGEATDVGSDGRFTYRSVTDGLDEFAYTVCDGGEVDPEFPLPYDPLCSSATIHLGTNAGPSAQADHLSAVRGQPNELAVTSNDTDPDGAGGIPAQVEVLTAPAHGFAYAQGGSLYYENDGAEDPTDSFTYRACDIPPYPSFPSAVLDAGSRCSDEVEVTLDIVDPAGPGYLRVTTDPPVPSTIVVDGEPRDTWGLAWLTIAAGQHEVCWTDVQSYSTPACEYVNVDEATTTEVVGEFEPRGVLRVTTEPAVPGAILIDGEPSGAWGFWADLPSGSHEVCFGPVAGFDPPPCQAVELSAGAPVTIAGSYATDPDAVGPQGQGLLRVVTDTPVPAQIVIDGRPTDRWGLAWMPIDAGYHTVCFSDVPGFSIEGARCQEVEVVTDQTTVVTGQFTANGYLRVLTEPALPATILVNGVARNDWGVWTDMLPQTVEVCFSPVAFWNAPDCQVVDLVQGETVVVTGSYTEQ